MRLIKRSAFGLLFASGVSVGAGAVSVACGGDKFDGCEAARTCRDDATGGLGGQSGGALGGGSGGKAGSAGKNGAGGKAGSAGKAGSGGSGHGDAGDAGDSGSDPSHGSGGTHSGSGGSATHDNGGVAGDTHDTTDDAGAAGDDHGAAGVSGTGGTGSPPGDTTPPAIVSTSPATMAKGVTEDTEIVVTFSERMDNAATEAAYVSDSLPPDAVKFSWRNDSTELVIEPKEPLVYAEVTDPTADAKHYDFVINGTATDAAGNPLGGGPHTFTFTTLRHLLYDLPLAAGGGVQIRDGEGQTNELHCVDADDSLLVGDDSFDVSLAAIATFDLSSLPPGVVDWTFVYFTVEVEAATVLNPYAQDRLGTLDLASVLLSDPLTAKLDTPVRTALGTLSTALSKTSGRRNARTALASDYAAREAQGNKSQYLVRFTKPSNGDEHAEYVRLPCSGLKLNLDYLAP